MRLHHLQMTAFGPFAGTVSVDFDALSDASVFLLCGDTGAGKTTVLDGVCFALYGDVPSARAAARQLRSHHAVAGVAPRVVLDLSVAGRRLRFTRSPAWQRPKKRGNGSTTEQARVLVEERDDAGWLLRSNRLDEAGHLVGELLGMTLAQFSQVVLLPQGQFDTFLAPTDILVCLLPLTPDTRGMLNRDVFTKLNHNSPLGAPVLINAGRGGLQNEAAILACLDDGTLGGVSLDVFVQEPLPADSPFWTHPKVVLTPHNAADTDPDAISVYVAEQIARHERGEPLQNVVDRRLGY